jgi:tRNA-dihydrouridine synthase
VGWLTLHPRYARQMFMGRAHWDRLAALVRSVDVPVVASGDLLCAEDAVRCVEETGVAGLMFARGALHDPSIFARYLALRRGATLPPADGPFLAAVVREHIRLTREFDGSPRSFRKIRSLIPRYARGLRDVRALRTRLLTCLTWEALEETAEAIAILEPADPHPHYAPEAFPLTDPYAED